MMPQDVPFDERLFESNDMLKQYYERSVSGRSVFTNLAMQRSAQEEDLRVQSMKLYENLVTKQPSEAEALLVREMEESREAADALTQELLDREAPLVAPEATGPLLAPKADTNTLLIIVIIIVSVIAGLLVLGYAGYNFYYSRSVPLLPAVAAPLPIPMRRPSPYEF